MRLPAAYLKTCNAVSRRPQRRAVFVRQALGERIFRRLLAVLRTGWIPCRA